MRCKRWAVAATVFMMAACSGTEQIQGPEIQADGIDPKLDLATSSGIAVDSGGVPAGAKNLGGVRFRSFNASGGDDVFLGVSSLGSTGQRGSKNFFAGALVDLVQDGDCLGDWDIGASTSARAFNNFSLTWDIAKDSLSVKVKNSQLDCTLAYRNFSAGVAVKQFSRFVGDATGDRAVAKAALRNLTYLQVQRNGNGQTVTPIVVSSLQLDDQYDVGNTAITSTGVEVTSGTFTTGRITGYDFDAGGGFTVSGKLEVGPQASCTSGEGCRAEFTFGSPTRRLTLDTAAAAVGSPVLAVVPNPVGSTPTASASAVTAANLPEVFRPFVLTGSNFFTLSATNADPANDLGYMICVNGSSPEELYYYNGTAWVKITDADLSSTGRLCGYANTTSLSAALIAVAAPTTYMISGFFHPVDMPTVTNMAKAGQTIPLKFRGVDQDGPLLGLVPADLVFASPLGTAGSNALDAIEFYSSGSSGLQYLGDGNYQYNWKVPTSFANTTRRVELSFDKAGLTVSNSGPITAIFQFRK